MNLPPELSTEIYPDSTDDLTQVLAVMAAAIARNDESSAVNIAHAAKLLQELGFHAGRKAAFDQARAMLEKRMDELGPEGRKNL